MKRLLQMLTIFAIAMCLLVDAWVVVKYVVQKPVRAVVTDSRPGEARVRFEKLPLGASDHIVFAIVVMANIGTVALVRKALVNVRRSGA